MTRDTVAMEDRVRLNPNWELHYRCGDRLAFKLYRRRSDNSWREYVQGTGTRRRLLQEIRNAGITMTPQAESVLEALPERAGFRSDDA